jgi:tetratricopeptide (TPR) repeat protein
MQCYIIKGLIYSFLGKFNWAARICLLVLAVYKGKDGYVYFLLALALTKLKRYEEAASIFKRIRMVKGSSNNQMEVI